MTAQQGRSRGSYFAHLLGLGLLVLGVLTVRGAELFPFVLPWDDAAPSATNLSAWPEKPAGQQGFVTVKDGHLYAGDKRLRIFGVNCAFGADFPMQEDAEKIAARMAKFGINCVRFHHMDMQSAPAGIWSQDLRTLDPGQLEKLDWFIAKLKEHGIYADLNLHVSRTYLDRPKSEKIGNQSYDKGVDNFSAPLIEEQKDYARALLGHVNPYTGNSYLNEPAVALIEINNENALLFEWWIGALDKIAPAYRAELGGLWTAWLKAAYPSDEKLQAAWHGGAHAGGPELLKNGSFTPDFEGWYLERHEDAEAEAKAGPIEGAASALRITVTKPGKEAWHVQMGQSGLKVRQGESYTFSFRGKADAARTARVGASMAHEPWTVFDSKEIKLTPEWQNFSFVFIPKQGDDNARISFTSLGLQPGVYDFADAHLTTSRVDGEVPPRDAAGQLPVFTRDTYAAHTPAAQHDWYRFLWSLEDKYWPGMYHFLKDDLKAKPLILGTQMVWSPFPIQEKLDVIDSHAYWQHPSFPNQQWNDQDWSVNNIPMAGAPDGGTLPRLALQRVAGKPYICTEYAHPAPNTYSAEGFPLVCAFAALQDWDGIFAFAYSHRKDDWDKGYVPSFFDIDQHPLKMATLPGALATWLRGDVHPAASERIAPVTWDMAFEQARRGGPRIGAEAFGVTTGDALTKRVGIELVPGKGNDHPPLIAKDIAEPAQFNWDSENHCVTIDTAKSKAVVGHLGGRHFQLGEITIAPGTTLQDWAVIQLTVLDGADFKSARRILITASGTTENTGQKWHNAEKTTVGRDWGHAPSLVEGIPATITLPGSAAKLKAWALDERGQRRAAVPIQNDILEIGPSSKTLWYELAEQ